MRSIAPARWSLSLHKYASGAGSSTDRGEPGTRNGAKAPIGTTQGETLVAKLLASILYGVRPHDVATFVSVPLFLAAVALLACWIPARRAAGVDPQVALRCE